MKKILILICFILVIICSSCDVSMYKKEQYEDEFYKYHLIKHKKIGSEYECYITGLTDLGKSQSHLILPEYYNDYKVLGICFQDLSWLCPMRYVGFFESESLEKIYVNFKIDTSEYTEPEVLNVPNCYVVSWITDSPDIRFYNHKGYIYGFNFYQKEDYQGTNSYYTSKIANVSYIYNYDNSPNEGYYWVDNYTNDLIKFIPPIPIREGYEFQGWYKEPECLNAWDFEKDILGDDILIGSEQILEYTGTYLYAKWRAL